MSDARNEAQRPKYGLAGLDAYSNAVTFYEGVRAATRGRRGHVVDQLQRAAESVALNVAEAHPTTGKDRARRFRIACTEASECSAALDLLEVRGEVSPAALARLRALLDREKAMLYRLSR